MRVAVGVMIALAALCMSPLCISASAQGGSPRTVLIIQEGSESFPGAALTMAAIRGGLKSRSDVSTEDFVEYLETDVVPVEDAADALESYIRRKYRSRSIDLVITQGEEALRFALARRPKLFADAPIVFSAVKVPDETVRGMGAGAAGIRIGAAYGETLKLALMLHPSTQHVFVVENVNQAIGQVIRDQFRELTNQATVTIINEVTVPRLLAAIRDVPPRSVILFRYHGQNAPGDRQYPDEVAALVASAARVPVYGSSDLYIGSGVVGGVVRDTHETAVRLGAIALRVLTGTRAQDIPIEDTPVAPVIDWRAMQRWGISESRLPLGSEIRFRGPSLWRDYRRIVVTALGALAVQSFLILALLYQRGARQRAEAESRRNLTLAADANRRVIMTTLAGSIAHELGQPLNGILHNAQAAEMLVASQRATPEKLREILADICTADLRATQIIERHRTMLRSRLFDPKPIDIHAVVRESVALIADSTRSKQIQVDVELPPDPCFVVGDPVLLQQVVVNLMINALDAMTETPPERRRLTVHNTVTSGNVELSVRDAGTGLPASFDGKLFEPFVTTKTTGMGIGLAIAHTIVEAHHGRIVAQNNPEGGATFVVTLPRAETPVGS